MKNLKSYVCGDWYEAPEGHVPLRDPSTEKIIAQASTMGLDFGAALDHARTVGGPALRKMTVAERGEVLGAMSKALHACRDELIELSMENTETRVGVLPVPPRPSPATTILWPRSLAWSRFCSSYSLGPMASSVTSSSSTARRSTL